MHLWPEQLRLIMHLTRMGAHMQPTRDPRMYSLCLGSCMPRYRTRGECVCKMQVNPRQVSGRVAP